MFMEATGGQVSRDEGWVIYLSTQSEEPPAGVFKEKLGYYRDVRDGKIVDRKSLGVIYEFPAAMVSRRATLNPRTSTSRTRTSGGLSMPSGSKTTDSERRNRHERPLGRRRPAGEDGWFAVVGIRSSWRST
jgi:hypothetical protein